ncbi:MAG: phosphoribosylglycinamide formyltransferase [Planctomycetota bacterium]|nr:MAG: phosphoribosylglycinamide formyltransferase [Planctomycetota bacterium]
MNDFRWQSPSLRRPLRVAVLMSGGGRTFQNLLDRSRMGALFAEIVLAVADRECGGRQRAEAAGIPVRLIPRRRFDDGESFSEAVFAACEAADCDVVAMAGFLSLLRIPDRFAFRVMNIHPSLIPAFCGPGFYGKRVHRAAIERGVRVSGCTVHFADNEYDHGPIILQRVVPVFDEDTPETLAARVFEQECRAYPEALELYAQGRLAFRNGRLFVDR